MLLSQPTCCAAMAAVPNQHLVCWGRTCPAQPAHPTPLHPARPQTSMPVCACLDTSQAPVAVCSACLVRSALAAPAGGAAVIECPPGATSPPGSDSTADCVCQPGYGKPDRECSEYCSVAGCIYVLQSAGRTVSCSSIKIIHRISIDDIMLSWQLLSCNQLVIYLLVHQQQVVYSASLSG